MGGVQTLILTDLAGSELVAFDAPSVYAFAADAEYLYWTNTVVIRRRPHGGVDEILLDGNQPPYSYSDALGLGPNALVFSSGGMIEAIDKDGDDQRILTPFPGWAPGFAVDDDAVYWTEPNACVVRRACLDGNSGATTLWGTCRRDW